MSPRPLLLALGLALLGLTLAAGCGPTDSESSGARFPLGLVVDGAVASQLGAFQVVVLPNGQSRDCTKIQTTCLNQQVKLEDALLLRDNAGHEARALRFSANVQGTSVRTQDFTLEVPVGRDYALVVEALSADSPPRFLGSSCNYLQAVNAGQNEPVLTAPMSLTSVECNPSFGP
jgi:ABC-type phosphate/phosphonate transport system substrate-binding protein